jgi:hypothetical protein
LNKVTVIHAIVALRTDGFVLTDHISLVQPERGCLEFMRVSTEVRDFVVRPSIDALQEFTGIYSGECGRATTQIKAPTKPGTNFFMALSFEFLRNDNLDAKEWRNAATRTIPPNPIVDQKRASKDSTRKSS